MSAAVVGVRPVNVAELQRVRGSFCMAEQPSNQDSSSLAVLDLRAHLAIVRKYWWFTVLVVVCAVAVAFLLTQRQERIYSTSAQVLLRSSENSFLFPFPATGPLALNREGEIETLYVTSPAFTEAALLKSPPEVKVAAAGTGSRLTFNARGVVPEDLAAAANVWAQTYVTARYAETLAQNVESIEFLQALIAEIAEDRDAIRVEVDFYDDLLGETTDPDEYSRYLSQMVSIETLLQPQLAPLEAQISEYQRQITEFESVARFLDSPDVSAQVSQLAEVPTIPVSPNVTRNLVVAAAFGMALGIALTYLREVINDKIEGARSVEQATGLAILGTIPGYQLNSDQVVEVIERPKSLAAERYEAVLTAIEFASIGEPVSSVLFTSAVPGDGKTTTAVNVAALASKYMNVLLVDGDMRRPRVHRMLGVSNSVGLSDVLAGEATRRDARQVFERDGIRFDVITSGSKVQDPALLLRGDGWSSLVDELFLYDLVIIDAPPVLAVTDAVLIGRAVNGQILLTRLGATKRSDLAEAAKLLATNGSRSLGVVVNRDQESPDKYSYYGQYAEQTAETADA